MTYVEDFLEMNANLPRDTIRLNKMIREIDEKCLNTQKSLSELRKKYIFMCKSKNRNEKNEQEVLKQIEKEYNYLISLSEHKVELVNEEEYLSGFHLKKLYEIIENYEKNIQSSNLQQALIPLPFGDYKISDKAMSVIQDDMSITGSKKRDTYSAKSGKDSGIGIISQTTQFLKKKKQRPSAKSVKKGKEEVEELAQNLVETNYIDFEKPENEPIYCICNGPSYGDMIQCDNASCGKEWFHYNCVNITATPKGKWFCSQECQQKAKKRKR